MDLKLQNVFAALDGKKKSKKVWALLATGGYPLLSSHPPRSRLAPCPACTGGIGEEDGRWLQAPRQEGGAGRDAVAEDTDLGVLGRLRRRGRRRRRRRLWPAAR